MRTIKSNLAIFDLDGTLFNTAPANYAAYAYALSQHGFSIDEQDFAKRCNGRYYRDFLPEIIGSDAALMEEIHRRKVDVYPEYFHKIEKNKALFHLLQTLREKYYTALVTTASRESTQKILQLFTRDNDFDLVLTQDDVPKKKPAPDGFLMAMEHFSLPPERTIIFEDAPEGIAAAHAAGAQCFQVRI